jgi:hypothetical protein
MWDFSDLQREIDVGRDEYHAITMKQHVQNPLCSSVHALKVPSSFPW